MAKIFDNLMKMDQAFQMAPHRAHMSEIAQNKWAAICYPSSSLLMNMIDVLLPLVDCIKLLYFAVNTIHSELFLHCIFSYSFCSETQSDSGSKSSETRQIELTKSESRRFFLRRFCSLRNSIPILHTKCIRDWVFRARTNDFLYSI